MEEGKERVKRQLPKVPRKAKSAGHTRHASSGSSAGNPNKSQFSGSKLTEQHSASTYSSPGNKSRDFMNYSLGTEENEDGEDSCVTVAVRVRPFSEREVRLRAKQTVCMNGKELVIESRDSKTLHFCYDFCFWSFDKNSPEFASQETVYSCLAHPLLDSAFEGYNTCLFAYGQTGSGKSYCIMGESDSPGIIPQFAEELFERINTGTDKDNSFKVEVSYYEIYKERINDLLASVKHTKRKNLRVREHPVMGPYVEDLSTYVASSYSDIEQFLALGNRFRATAATGMNDRSSRSHSVFTMVLTQIKVIDDNNHSRVSRINLIDLAGSERSSVSNTSGERLREGASINKSLHTLSKVISLLAERSTGKRKKVYIPYRDSTLTWLLKESLGGNSKTAMIATVSPADIHKEESLSTLRYAQQARSIVNVARVNEDPQSKLIRDLRQEIEWLRSQLHGSARDSVDIEDLLRSQEEAKQMRAKLTEYEKLMEETTRSWEERLRRTEDRKIEEAEQLKRAGVSFKVDNKLPNLVNLNEDPQLSEMLLYVLKEGKTTVGRNVGCDIQLAGTLVARNHCIIENNNGEVTLCPSTNEEAQTFVNGTLVSSSIVPLHHGDRLVIAGEHFFRFNHPLQVDQGSRKISRGRNFEFARDEFIKAQTERLEAERLKERQEMMEKLEAVKQAADYELTKQKQSYEEKLRDLEGTLVEKNTEVSEQLQQQENEAVERILELERQNRELEEETIAQRHIIELERLKTQQEYEEMEEQSSRLMKELEQEKMKLEMDVESLQKNQENRRNRVADDGNDSTASSMDLIRGSELLRIATMIQEANVISKSLMRPFTFSREDMFENDEVTIAIKVSNTKLKKVTFWNPEKFESRLEQMRELYQHTGSVTSLDQEGLGSDEWSNIVGDSDPFHDPEDKWVHDSLLSSYSPMNATDGKLSSVLSIFTPPGSATRHTPRSSVPDFPKRIHLGSVSSTPLLELPLHSSFTSPTKQAAETIAQICYEKMEPILSYQHNSNPSIFSNILNHVKRLKSVINELTDNSKGERVMELFLSIQLMFESTRSLETSLSVLGANDEEILARVPCRSLECVQHMIDDVSKQTSLFSSRLMQALMSNSIDDCQEWIGNIDESLEGLVSSIGQISLCLRVEEVVCDRDRQSSHIQLSTDDQDGQFTSLFQYGYQTWCSTLLSELLRALHFQLDQLQTHNTDTVYSIREVLGHIIQLLHQISEIQELFWHMVDKDTLELVVTILSKVWRAYASIDTMCSLILNLSSSPPSIDKLVSVNQQVSVWSEQTAISLISFLRKRSSEDVITEVQSIARNIAMTTRSFNQHLKQKSIISPLLGGLISSNSNPPPIVEQDNDPSLPADFFLPSPTPPHSDTQDISDSASNTSLV